MQTFFAFELAQIITFIEIHFLKVIIHRQLQKTLKCQGFQEQRSCFRQYVLLRLELAAQGSLSSRKLGLPNMFNKTFANWTFVRHDICQMGRLFDRIFDKQLFYLTTNDPLNPKLGQVRLGQVRFVKIILTPSTLSQIRLVINFAYVHFPVGKCPVEQTSQLANVLLKKKVVPFLFYVD